MKIDLEQVQTSPTSLRLGVVIRGPKDSWMRFAILDVPFAQIPSWCIDDYWAWLDRRETADVVDDPLPIDFA